jgi:MFS family permease
MCLGVVLQTCSNTSKATVLSIDQENASLYTSTVAFFVGARIVVGFGITLALAPAPVLISELAHPKDRVVFTAMYNTVCLLPR